MIMTATDQDAFAQKARLAVMKALTEDQRTLLEKLTPKN
jgi:hypothetical protein